MIEARKEKVHVCELRPTITPFGRALGWAGVTLSLLLAALLMHWSRRSAWAFVGIGAFFLTRVCFRRESKTLRQLWSTVVGPVAGRICSGLGDRKLFLEWDGIRAEIPAEDDRLYWDGGSKGAGALCFPCPIVVCVADKTVRDGVSKLISPRQDISREGGEERQKPLRAVLRRRLKMVGEALRYACERPRTRAQVFWEFRRCGKGWLPILCIGAYASLFAAVGLFEAGSSSPMWQAVGWFTVGIGCGMALFEWPAYIPEIRRVRFGRPLVRGTVSLGGEAGEVAVRHDGLVVRMERENECLIWSKGKDGTVVCILFMPCVHCAANT